MPGGGARIDCYFVGGPYLFGPRSPSFTNQMKSGIAPITVRLSNCHHPLRFVSCSRLDPAAKVRIDNASWTSPDRSETAKPKLSWIAPAMPVATAKTMFTNVPKRTNHQYSERLARPENVKGLERQTRTEVINGISAA